MKFTRIVLLLGALLVFPLAAAGLAQEGNSSRRPGVAISENELNSFVKAYVEYQRIRASYGPTLESTKDPQRKKRIEEEANRKVKQSLDANGLTADRYNKIFAAVNSDEELRKRVLKKVQDQRQKS